MRGCDSDYGDKEIINIDGKDFELLEQKTDTIYVEKEVKVTKYVPKYITKEVIKEVEIPVDVDSLAIIKDYFSKVTVKDTLNLAYDFPDVVTDSVVYNTTIVKELPKTEFYYGFGVGVDQTNGFGNLSLNGLVKTKKQQVYGLNLGLSNQAGQYKPFIGTSFYWKIGKK